MEKKKEMQGPRRARGYAPLKTHTCPCFVGTLKIKRDNITCLKNSVC